LSLDQVGFDLLPHGQLAIAKAEIWLVCLRLAEVILIENNKVRVEDFESIAPEFRICTHQIPLTQIVPTFCAMAGLLPELHRNRAVNIANTCLFQILSMKINQLESANYVIGSGHWRLFESAGAFIGGVSPHWSPKDYFGTSSPETTSLNKSVSRRRLEGVNSASTSFASSSRV